MVAIVEEHIAAVSAVAENHGKKSVSLEMPKDRYFLCYWVFLLTGIIHFLPTIAFNSANNFWMYKFRNLTDPTLDAKNRTTLQTYFTSTQVIANTLPSVLIGWFNLVHGHKFKILDRLVWCLIVQLVIILMFTAFTKIDTDDYQLEFYVFVTIFWAILSGANTLYLFSSTMLYPRFPKSYMEMALYGDSMASVIGDLLNIGTVSMFNDVTNSTLTFYITCSCLIALTIILTIISSKTTFFKHYMNTLPEDTTMEAPSKTEIFKIFNKLRISIFMFIMIGFGLADTLSIVPLVVSQEEEQSTKWAKKFFSPIVTFFWSDCCGLFGRYLAVKTILKKLSDTNLCIGSVIMVVLVIPLTWFCNAQPRHHLPILFPYDYQFAIITAVLQIMIGFLINMGLFLIPGKTTKEESETAFNIFNLIYGIITMVTSFLGLIIVKIL